MTMKVYLVEDTYNSPGRIYAVFADKEDAERFIEEWCTDEDEGVEAEVRERTLCYGQQNTGYVK